MVGVYPIAKILTLKGTRRLVSLAQNDRTITCVVLQRADNIRPYAVFRMFRDVEDAVPYAVMQKHIHSLYSNLYYTQTKTRPQRSGFIIGFIKLLQL